MRLATKSLLCLLEISILQEQFCTIAFHTLWIGAAALIDSLSPKGILYSIAIKYPIVRLNKPIIMYNFFLSIFCFDPINSAAIKNITNKKSPRPAFHVRLNVPGEIIIVKIIGAIRNRVTTIPELIPNFVNSIFLSEETLFFLLNKCSSTYFYGSK